MPIERPRKSFLKSRIKRRLAIGLATGVGLTSFGMWHKKYKPRENVAPTHYGDVFNPDSWSGISKPKSELRKKIVSSLVHNLPDVYSHYTISRMARNIKGLKRVKFFKDRFEYQPRETYRAVEEYLKDYAKDNNLNPDLVKFIFYHRQFDLRNPLGVEYIGVIRKFAGKYVTKKDFENDPFLGIEVGVKYMTFLANKYHRKGIISILTEYLYGPFSSREQFNKQMIAVRHRFAAYKKHYKSLFNSVLIRAPGKLFYSNLKSNFRDYYRYLTDFEFNKLSEKGKKFELYNYMKYISKQFDLNPKILFRMAVVESTFNPHAYNKFTHATGLMQIEPILFKDLIKHVDFKSMLGKTPKFEDLNDAYTNVLFSAIYLKYCLENLDYDYNSALSAYNMGFGKYIQIRNLGGNRLDTAKRYLNKIYTVDVDKLLARKK